MLTKKLGTDTSTYHYNVRSWLTQIQRSSFNQTLAYHTTVNSGKPSIPRFNGNISAMKWKAGTETTERGYQLTSVTDAATAAVTYYGALQFTDGANVTTEYIYDMNGNLKKDYNKKIVDIQYNSLNLPDGL